MTSSDQTTSAIRVGEFVHLPSEDGSTAIARVLADESSRTRTRTRTRTHSPTDVCSTDVCSTDGVARLQLWRASPTGGVELADEIEPFDVDTAVLTRTSVVKVGEGWMYEAAAAAIPSHPIVIEAQLNGFIVPDTIGEGFGIAPRGSDGSFVDETHAAVHEWNDWNPSLPAAKRYKRFVEGIEERCRHDIEDDSYRRGRAMPDTTHPPRRSKRNKH